MPVCDGLGVEIMRRIFGLGQPLTVWLALCCLAPVAPLSAALPMSFTHLSTDDDASAGPVLAMHQDSMGFIRLGTEDGLLRYDG